MEEPPAPRPLPRGGVPDGPPPRGWRRFLVESPRPDFIRQRPDAYWFAVATVCVGAFMNQLDASIVTVALPTLQHQFDASVGAVTWVGLSYLIVLVGLVTAFGHLADMVGRKLLYLYGFVVFIVGSALCGLAPTLLALDLCRVVQGTGAAMLQANSVAIIVLAVPGSRVGRAIGVQGAAQALGLALGPTIGGLLIAAGGWRLIFYVNVPAGIVGVVLGWYLIPRSRELQPRVAFDWTGLALFLPAVVALLSAVSFGNSIGWTSALIVGLFVAAAALGSAFVWWEHRAPAPMLDLSLFRRLPFSAGISSGFLSFVLLFGVLFVVPFYLERAVHQGPARAGLELAVLPVALGLVAPLAGRWAERLGARPLTVGGMALASATMALVYAFHADTWQLLAELAVIGVALGLFTPPNNAAIMGAAPRPRSGMASGVLNMTRGMGTAMGLASTALVFGLVAGSQHAPPHLVAQGFEACAVFLGVVAVAAMALSALRGPGPLRTDPAAMAE